MKKVLTCIFLVEFKGKDPDGVYDYINFPTLMILIFSYVNTSRIVKDHAGRTDPYQSGADEK